MAGANPYSIPQEPGRWRAIALAALVHAALFAFLWIGIRWQSEIPVAIEAEVWNAQPREAAPVPRPEPQPEKTVPVKPQLRDAVIEPPTVAQPDIALELKQKKKLKVQQELKTQQEENKRLADEKIAEKAKALAKKNEDAEKKRKQDMRDATMIAKTREEEMRRINASIIGGNSDASQSQGRSADANYGKRLGAKIKSMTTFRAPLDFQDNPTVEYRVDLFPDGSIKGSPQLKHASGLPGFDEAVKSAIQQASPYPPDKSGMVPTYFIYTQRPKENK